MSFIGMLKYELLMWLVLFAYIPLHLLEEAVGDWPDWMVRHKYTSSKLSYGHWMAGNIFFFFPLLLVGIVIFHFFGNNFIFLGLGVIFWGLLNFLEHFVFSFIDRKITPGFYTSLLFMGIGVLTIIKIISEKNIGLPSIVFAILASLIYAAGPILLQMSIGEKVFKKFI